VLAERPCRVIIHSDGALTSGEAARERRAEAIAAAAAEGGD
jgi:hypothetical protein